MTAVGGVMAPLILTLVLDAVAQARLDALCSPLRWAH